MLSDEDASADTLASSELLASEFDQLMLTDSEEELATDAARLLLVSNVVLLLVKVAPVTNSLGARTWA